MTAPFPMTGLMSVERAHNTGVFVLTNAPCRIVPRWPRYYPVVPASSYYMGYTHLVDYNTLFPLIGQISFNEFDCQFNARISFDTIYVYSPTLVTKLRVRWWERRFENTPLVHDRAYCTLYTIVSS